MKGREAGEGREVEKMIDCGFSGSLRQETQLAVLGTARRAIYIVQYLVLLSRFLISKHIRDALGKDDKTVRNHDSPIRNPLRKTLTKALRHRLGSPH